MEHESPIMKAWREFALADPEDCDREWEAYLALVSGKETASVSPPANTTSALHSRVHSLVSASSSTRSTASLHAPGSAISTTTPAAPASASTSTRDSSPATKDDLSPEARLIYDYIVGNSDEFASRDGLSPGARRYYDSLISGSAPPASATTDVFTNLLVRTEVDAVHDAVNNDDTHLAASTPSTCSTICLAGDTSATTTPASSTTVSSMLSSPAEIEDIQDAVDFGVADFSASVPTTCSVELPSHAASVYAAALIPSSEEPPSSTTTACVSQQCCFDPEPVVVILTPTSTPDLLEGVDDLSSTSPSVCLSLWSSGGICTVAYEACSVNPLLALRASTFSLTPPSCIGYDVSSTVALLSVMVFTEHKLIGVLLPATEIKRPPWPPPWFVSFKVVISCKDMIQVLSTQLMLWAAKNAAPWPPPWVELIRSSVVIWLCCFSSQGAELLVSGDWHFLVKLGTEWNATLTVITFDFGVQCVQLQPVVFKMLDHSCCGTHYLLASATANKMFDFLLVRRAACALWISCCLDNLHCSLGKNALAIPDWVMSNPWPPPLRMWLNLPMGNIPNSPGRIVVVCLCIASVLRYLNSGSQIIEPKPPWSLIVTNSSNFLRWFLHMKIPSGLTAAVCKSEIRFYTPGYILFLCCALVRLKKSWTIILVSLKTGDELDMRPDLSLQPDIPALGCCNIQWPIWEACFSFPKLQYYAEFGSTTRADQSKYRTEDYMEGLRGTCFWFSTVGNASNYGSSHFQWYIAWSNTLAHAAVPTIYLARPIIILLTAETLASIPGMQFLLGGATVHYSAIFQLEIAWKLEFECFEGSSQLRQPISLADVSELLDIISAGITTLQTPWDPGVCSSFAQRQGISEGLNDAWPLVIGNGYEVFMVRYPSLQVLVVLSFNGYVGRTTPYGTKQSEWKIAWPPLNQFMLNAYHTISPGTPIEIGLLKDVLVQDWLICLTGHIIQCGFEITQWRIAWSFFCEYFDVGNQSRNFIPAATLTYPVWYFPWDPGIWACLYFYRFSSQAKATKGIKFEARAYYQGHCLDRDYYFDIVCADKDYSLDIFHDQVHICDDYLGVFLEQVDVVCYINLVKVCLDYDDHHDLGEVMKHQVLWDPGGSAWHRLEVKPNFKEGGLSTTSYTSIGLDEWATTLGPSLHLRRATNTLGHAQEETWLGTGRKGGFGRGLALARISYCSSLSIPKPFLCF